MEVERTGTPSIRGPMQFWKRMKRRWQMTLVGAAMGTFASSLWTIPGAYFALNAGYTAHGTIYVAATILGIAGMATVMHFLGIRQERVINGTD